MKRFLTSLLALCAMPLLLFGQEAQLPYLEARKDASGLYGYFDEEGNNVMPCIFDWALSFSRGHMVSVIEKDDLYYLVDRDGYLVVNDGFSSMPEVFVNFARVGDDKQGHYIIDLAGCRLSPEGWNVIPVERDSRYGDPVLFAMAPVGDEQNGYYLADFRFEPLSEVRSRVYSHMIYCPEVIEYTGRYDDVTFSYGVMNAAGQVLVEAGLYTKWLEEERLSNLDRYYKWLRKSGTYGLYDKELQGYEMVFLIGSGDGMMFMCDVTGKRIVPVQMSRSQAAFFKRNFKDFIAPYLRRNEENHNRYAELVAEPFERCEALARELAPKAVSASVRTPAVARELDVPAKGIMPDEFNLYYIDGSGSVGVNFVRERSEDGCFVFLNIGDNCIFASDRTPVLDEENGLFVIEGISNTGDVVVVTVSLDWKRVIFSYEEFNMVFQGPVKKADYDTILRQMDNQ